MPAYYVPSTKKELILLIKRSNWGGGVTITGLEIKTKKQLYAIFHNIRRRQTNIDVLKDGLI